MADQQQDRQVIPLQPVKSSNLDAVGYDNTTSTLAVKFKNGSEYHYAGVPAELFEQLLAAPSVGSFYGSAIRGKFDGTRQ